MLYNAVANGGRMVRPLLVESTQLNGQTVENFSPEVIRESICSKETLAAAQAMLRAVADPAGVGTGRTLFKDRPYTVAGKTGTSRVVRDGVYDGTYRASFAGYFPAEAPRYSCIVVVAETQSGVFYGGSIAGPIFQELADKVYATDPSFHADAAQAPLAAMRRNPYLLHGPKVERERLLEHWGWTFSDSARGDVDWVEAIATDSTLTLKPRAITRGVIPDVRGMGLRDALYLLENAGLTVQYNGIGSVRQQSIEPGTPCARQTISLQLR
jgi:cell division protein FtsI (penicillin-binding protein 3)